MYIKTRTARLYPNSHMRTELDKLCDYRRYCWNLGLETWNEVKIKLPYLVMPSIIPSTTSMYVTIVVLS